MGQRLRIAAHNGASVYGGGEKWTLLLLAGLRERGHKVHFFCRDDAMRARAESLGVPSSVGRLGGQLMIPDAVRFSRQLRRWSPDVLLVSTFKKIWLAGMAARWAGVPRVVSRIGLSTDLPRRHWTYRHAFRRWVDAVLVNADAIRTGFLTDLPKFDPRRIATVYDGIELREGPPRNAARRALNVPSDVPIVGSVTRLSAQKRLDRMLEAVALLEGVHLVLAGEGDLDARLRELAASLGIAQRVHFLGFRDDVPLVLAALDLFLVTSDKEGMANAMLEAMAAGVPVVSTPVSGAAEALQGGEPSPGRIVEPNPRAIASAIRGILDDPVRREEMSSAGRLRAVERFAFDRMLDDWEHVIAGGDPVSVHRGPSALVAE